MYVINVGMPLFRQVISQDTNASIQVRNHMYVINVGMHIVRQVISQNTNASMQMRSHICVISVGRTLVIQVISQYAVKVKRHRPSVGVDPRNVVHAL